MIQHSFESLYNASIKKLYNLALFTTGNQTVSEQITSNTFAYVFSNNKYEINRFMMKCVRILYIYGKRAASKTYENDSSRVVEDITYMPINRRKSWLIDILKMLNYRDRFILLLYCYIKFSMKQIAYILRMPKFMVRKRIIYCLNITAMIFD